MLVHGHLPEEPPSAVPVDPVDQRADAFALAFLAPKDEVDRLAPLPVDELKVGRVMQHFGMCEAAARRRIVSCTMETPNCLLSVLTWPCVHIVRKMRR